MSNKSVLGAPNIGHKVNRTSFPLGNDLTFTAAPGMLLPVYKKFLNIGEKIKGVPRFFLRTDPLLAPSMTDIDVYVDTFFVPMNHIFSMWNQWFTQVSDDESDMWTNGSWTDHLPVLGTSGNNHPFGWMTRSIFDKQIYHSNRTDDYGTYGFGMHRLTMHLGFNAQAIFCHNQETVPSALVDDIDIQSVLRNKSSLRFSPYLFAAYQKIYMDVYRDTEFEVNNIKSYNLDSVFNGGTNILDPTTEQFSGIAPDGLDNPRLGMFQLRYRSRNKDYFTAIHRSPIFGDIGFLSNAAANLNNIKDWLTSTKPLTNKGNDGGSLQIQSIGSLQNEGDAIISSMNSSSDLGRWNSPNNSITFDNQGANSTYYYGASKNFYQNTIGNLLHTHSIDLANIASNIRSQVDLQSLRVGFAFEKLLRVMNSAGRHADDQLFALFGVKLPQGIANETYRIKSYHTMVHLGEVVATAQTETTDGGQTSVTPLGEMAGRGVALLNSKDSFEFTAPCHGIFMTIFSIAPRYKYIGAVEKENFKVYLHDFFKPQIDNLGKQPIFNYETGVSNLNGRGGWQYAYMEDKISFDKVSLAFATKGLSPWAFSCTAPNYNMSNLPQFTYQFNKVSPKDLNPIFVAHYESYVRMPKIDAQDNTSDIYYPDFPTAYLRDPFKVDFSMKLFKLSEMSRFGEPELGGI